MMVWNGQPDWWTGSFNITMEDEFGLAPLWCAALRLVLWAVVVAITIHLLHCTAWYSNVCLLLKGEHNVQATDEQGNFSLVFLKCRKTPPSPHLSIRGSPRKMSICWLPYFLWLLPMPFTHLAHHLHRKRLDEEVAVGWEDPVLLLTSPYSPALLRWAAHPLFNITLPLTLIILFWTHICVPGGFPGGTSVKKPNCQCRKPQRAWVRKIPWRRAWQPTPVFLPGESHGQRSLEGYSPWGRKESDTTEATYSTHSCCVLTGEMAGKER